MTFFFLLNPKVLTGSRRAGGYIPDEGSLWWRENKEVVDKLVSSDGPDKVIDKEVLEALEREVVDSEVGRVRRILSTSFVQDDSLEKIHFLEGRLKRIQEERVLLSKRKAYEELVAVDMLRDRIIQIELEKLRQKLQQEMEDEELFMALYEEYY